MTKKEILYSSKYMATPSNPTWVIRGSTQKTWTHYIKT